MKSSVQAILLTFLILAGAVLTLWAEQFEGDHPLASVRVLTPEQWAALPSPTTKCTLRSPALALPNLRDSGAYAASFEPSELSAALQDSLPGLLLALPVLPVDTQRLRLWNECCSFNLKYPVSLQFKALLQMIALEGGSQWTVVVPDAHHSTWLGVLKSSPIVETYPNL